MQKAAAINTASGLVVGKAVGAVNMPVSLTGMETNSLWNNSGLCIAGVKQGKQLAALQAYQEYWHSWKNFHPNTTYTAKFL